MIDLVYSSNIEFLLPKDEKREDGAKVEFRHDLTPLFAAGEVYISSIIDTLTSQAYYNPHIVTIIQQLVTGGKQSSSMIRNICDLADLKQSNLWQIPIPEDYLNKTFGELFNYLAAQRELIPMGLYRLPGSTDNKYPYVFTNPPPSTKLTQKDKVFVLAANMPNDLLEESNIGHKTGKGNEAAGYAKTQGNPTSQFQTTVGSHTQISFDKEDPMKYKRQDSSALGRDLNRSREIIHQKRELRTMMTGAFPLNGLNGSRRLPRMPLADPDNMNQNSATSTVLDQVSGVIRSMHQEINSIRESMEIQDKQILEKIKNSLKQEISTLGR